MAHNPVRGRDPVTKKWKQKWLTFTGTKTAAETKMRELVSQVERSEFIEPTKVTLGEWLEEWLEKSVKVKHSARTYTTYKACLNAHLLKSELSMIHLHRLTPLDIERYHHSKMALSQATRDLHHAILSAALKLAMREKRVRDNAATQATERPTAKRKQRVMKAWTEAEARCVLDAAKLVDPQTAAFFALALDSGARRGELLGLRWSDVDMTTGALQVERQLVRGWPTPEFGPTKKQYVCQAT